MLQSGCLQMVRDAHCKSQAHESACITWRCIRLPELVRLERERKGKSKGVFVTVQMLVHLQMKFIGSAWCRKEHSAN